jgi:hypothetical protein
MCCAWMSRITSRKTTGGVRTTASAKLKASARDFATPASIPAEMVAPDREKPRNGKQRPCTAPIKLACRVFRSFVSVRLLLGFLFSRIPAININTPAAASAGAMSSRWLKSSSISACGRPRKAVFSMILIIVSQTMPVSTVAKMRSQANFLKAEELWKYVVPHERQK